MGGAGRGAPRRSPSHSGLHLPEDDGTLERCKEVLEREPRGSTAILARSCKAYSLCFPRECHPF